MAVDFEGIVKKYAGEDGAIPAEAVEKVIQAVSSSVGREFVEKTRYNKRLEEIETLKTEKQTAEDNATTAAKWKVDYDALKTEYDNYKSEIAAKEARAAKSAALETYFKRKGIDGGNLKIAMLSAAAQIDALELKKDGAIKDTAALDALVSGDLAPLVSHIETVPAHNPPASSGAVMPSGDGMTIDDIYKIEDATERQKAINEHPELFGYSSP